MNNISMSSARELTGPLEGDMKDGCSSCDGEGAIMAINKLNGTMTSPQMK